MAIFVLLSNSKMTHIPKDKILILDGATGTMIQRYGLSEADYRDGVFEKSKVELHGNSECLNLTRPEIIRSIHREYLEAGADIIETNTFSANRISQAEYGCEDYAARMAYEGAQLAREVADEYLEQGGRRILVAGSMGPTSKSLSLSPDVSDPGFRPYSFDQMREAYREQAQALLEGGADLLLIETCFDALNVKAALAAIQECNVGRRNESTGNLQGDIPVMISVSVSDRSGRTLTGQTLKAFYTAVSHYPLLAFGLNCSLGAAEMTPLVEEISQWCDCAVSCYPNAGLPNEMGGYDQSPEDMAQAVRTMAAKGLLNIAGGCCGTTPDHIRAIADALTGISPRPVHSSESVSGSPHPKDASRKTALFMDKGARLTVSGLEAVTVDIRQSNFTNVGERTNVAGSRKFARLISEGKYDEALQIAARQIEDGATIIDINMDDAMLDSTREMERFVRHISNDPAVAKAALMIDSSHWETIEAGLKNAQGKCIVNSISLKEGPEQFIEKAKAIKSLGAAVVIMAFDEEGQATTFDRKIEICSKAYRILTEEAGLSPENIIFDANILSIGTGIEEHSKYAIDFIEAVRWIKTNLPGALTSGGVSNLSFSFRGNNAVREAMHSAFLYHAVKAGLDMAIVNPSMLQIYDEIEPELLRCVEDVIFDRDPQATERLIDKAARMMMEKETGNQDITGKAELKESAAHTETVLTPGERLKAALIKGRSETLAEDLEQAIYIYGKAVDIIEGPLMEGMETVGKMFGEGKMFLPQVVKSAKVMRDAVEILQPYMDTETAQPGNSKAESGGAGIETADSNSGSDRRKAKPKITLATVKGDVHDIGKNITGIVLTCNGFQVNDLGVMVDKETILRASDEASSDIIAVSGLITPSLYQMEELCREMAERNMTKPLFVGGATTSALHTAVKLAPLYGHVFHGPDASSAAVMAKKYMMDPAGFEAEEHKKQEEIRKLYHKQEDRQQEDNMEDNLPKAFGYETYPDGCPTDIPAQQIPSEEVLQYFDWKMFYAIWGVKYGSSSMEAMELVQLRRDAEEEIALGNFRIMLSARFFPAYTENDDIVLVNGRNSAEAGLDSHDGNRTGSEWKRIPMMRQEKGDRRSLCDYIIAKESGRTSPLGCFAISVHAADAHEEGCCCPACSNKYEDLIGKTVRMTLAEATSTWLDKKILQQMQQDVTATDGCSRNSDETIASKVPLKVIKPAAGYSSCPDHSLKRDILELLGETTVSHHSHGRDCTCGYHHDEHPHGHSHTEGHGHGQETGALKIRLTETCAMTPEASICGTIFIHPEARYPEIRSISQEQHDSYIARRGMNEDTARRFLSHLLK